jgi:DNA-binding beta-propeller fold protein YncE
VPSILDTARHDVVATHRVGGTGTVTADGQRLFVPHSFYTGRVTVLDTRALEVTTKIVVEDGAVRPRLSWDDRYLYVPNGSSFDGRITVVDTGSHSIPEARWRSSSTTSQPTCP